MVVVKKVLKIIREVLEIIYIQDTAVRKGVWG